MTSFITNIMMTKWDEISGARSTDETMINIFNIESNVYIDEYGRIILKANSYKTWAGFNWLSARYSGVVS
jgi:hypothetical protein